MRFFLFFILFIEILFSSYYPIEIINLKEKKFYKGKVLYSIDAKIKKIKFNKYLYKEIFKKGYIKSNKRKIYFELLIIRQGKMILKNLYYKKGKEKIISRKCKILQNNLLCEHVKIYENGSIRRTKIRYKDRIW